MTYRTISTIKTVVFMVIVATIMVYGLLSFQNKTLQTNSPAQINISAQTIKYEKGSLYLPIINGNKKIYSIIEEKNELFKSFVREGKLHSVTHSVTFVNRDILSIVWEGNYKGTANDIDGTESDVSYKSMDSLVINLKTKKEMSISEIAKWVIETRYEYEEIDINLKKIKDSSFESDQKAYVENGEDKFPNIVLYWRNNLDLMKYNKQKINGEKLIENLK